MPKHITRAAEIVNAIREGYWTHELPEWAHTADTPSDDHVRAAQTAEAFILLFQETNPRFNAGRFIRDCGFMEPIEMTERKG